MPDAPASHLRVSVPVDLPDAQGQRDAEDEHHDRYEGDA